MATLIRVGEPPKTVEVPNGELRRLAFFHEMIDGYFECLYSGSPLRGRKCEVMLIDEEGKLKGKPVNIVASLLAWEKFGLPRGESIAGDVLVVSVPKEFA